MTTTTTLEQVCSAIPHPDEAARRRVQARLDQLTKPPGSLGRLEDLALRLAAIQATDTPRAARKLVVVMAGDHGITQAGVSAYPAEVTGQMVANFLAGGAAINVLARHAQARLLVVDMGVRTLVASRGPNDGTAGGSNALISRRLGPGTRSFLDGPAMSGEQALAALLAGIEIAQREADGLDLIAGGDMGIGNTSASSAILALATGAPAAAVVGRGTGVDDPGLARKRDIVERAVAFHGDWRERRGGVDLLRRVGGFEIAGLAGLMLGAASRRVPIVLDGFIATAAAVAACEICPRVRHAMIAAHRSAEPGHRVALDYLGLEPLLEWDLHLGEGTGAALVFPLLDAACKLLAEMATFASAGVAVQHS